MSFADQFLAESAEVLKAVDTDAIERCAVGLAAVRERGGRLFILGVGGSAGHASHAVNDFRKICGFEAYTPTDNVSELTARANDEGWETTFSEWLDGSHLREGDGVLVFSVGGGDRERGVSANLVKALELARERSSSIFGIVGRDGGYTAAVADACVLLPPLYPDHITPHTEGLCAVIWHLLVSHPALARVSHKVGVTALSEAPHASIAMQRVVVVGGAGFIGGHFVDRLLAEPTVEKVTVYDNFSSGRHENLAAHADDPRLEVVSGEVADIDRLRSAMVGHDSAIHLASNPDIAAAMSNPSIDFDEGTQLTHCVLEAMRRAEVGRIIYASGSGVYGDLGEIEAEEDRGALLPVSTYGASKLAGEALISAYCYMFEMTGRMFRFGNVIGPRQSHGVGLDFVRKLLADPDHLDILGDGSQSKSYVHVSDVLEAVLLAVATPEPRVLVCNVATEDYLTVAEIADLAVEAVGLRPADVEYRFSGGNRGWKGDVPVVRLNSSRIRSLGWKNQRNTTEAMRAALDSIVEAVHPTS